MEFLDYLVDESGENNAEPMSLHRQRIMAAQIKDSELGAEDVLLANADTFDASVETSVLANESALMEMDEVITQIQQWRQLRPISDTEAEDEQTDQIEHSAYRSQAYDSLFPTAADSTGPETESDCPEGDKLNDYNGGGYAAQGSRKEKQYVPDEEMIQKLQSLQSMIRERQSTASQELHALHVSEYQALVTLLRSRFGDYLFETEQGDDDSDDIDSNSSGSPVTGGGSSTRRNNNYNSKYNNNNNVEDADSSASNNNYNDSNNSRNHNVHNSVHNREHSAPNSARGNVKHTIDADSALQSRFHTIDLEVREGNYLANRRREDEVIQQSADLQQEVATLEDTLRDYSSDLDRLLLG